MAEKQGWSVSLSLAVVGILGALLGSSVQHLLSLHRQRTQVFEERRRDAYIAFLNALDKSRVARQERTAGHEEKAQQLETEFELEGGAALRRIAIYGDREVVEAIARYARQIRDPDDSCSTTWQADLAIYERMRNISMGESQRVNPRDFAEVALFCTPPS